MQAATVNHYISVSLKMDWSGFTLFPARGAFCEASGGLEGWDLEGRDRDAVDVGRVGVWGGVVEEVDHHLGRAGGVAHGVVADAGDVDDVGVREALGCHSGLPGGRDQIE